MSIELDFVGNIVKRPELLSDTAIRPEDLQEEDARLALFAVRSLQAKNIPVDIVSLGAELSDSSVLAKVISPSSSNFTYFERELTRSIQRRRLEHIKATLSDMLDTGQDNGAIVGRIEDMLSESSVQHETSLVKSWYQCAMEFGPILEKRAHLKGALPGIPSGFPKLDELTGGFQPGTYYIGARPSQGKTALMLSMMRAAIHSGAGAGLISIESSEIELISRILSAEGPIRAGGLKGGSLTAAEYSRLTDSLARIKDFNGQIYFNTKTDIRTLETVARRMIKSHGVEIIFIDYLQRVNASGRNKFEQVTEASRAVTDIAKGMGVPVVCLAQTGRQADSEQPGLSHFQHSSAIEQDADVAMVISHSKDEASFDSKEESWLNVLKNRDGAVGNVPVYFDREHVTFKPREIGE